jgi:hypothetical protein
MTDQRLSIVSVPHPQASVLQPAITPCFQGDEDESLLCGGCSAVVSAGVSTQTISRRFGSPVQLILKCPECHANNFISSQFVPENAAFG